MKLRIDLKILFFLALFYLTKQLNIYLLVLVFAFLHELAHMFVSTLLEFKPIALEIMPFGFCMNIMPKTEDYDVKIRKSNLIDLKYIYVAMSGPILNLIIATVFSSINLNINSEINNIIIYSNLLIFIFNLIPIYPLDGGRIVKSILKINKGSILAEKYMKIISKAATIILTAISSVAILYLKNISILFIIIYLWILDWKVEEIN